MTEADSTSGFVMPDAFETDSSFYDRTEIPTSGFNRIVLAKRYGKRYVLKGLKPEYASQSLYLELLKKEFDISLRMDHPGIVRTIGLEKVDGLGLCIVFEYIAGKTLRDYLDHPHTLRERRTVADELVEALAYVHRLQIVHRDLKPENILICDNGNHVRIIDFGLADTDFHAVLKQPAGTRKYVSPEQRTVSEADCRNDLYSLGLILKELEAGTLYRLAARRCLKPLNARFPNAEALQRYIRRGRRLSRVVSLSLTAGVVAVLAVLAFLNSGRNAQVQQAARTIDEGKRLIDEITVPMCTFMDTVRVYDDAAYDLSRKIYEERSSRYERMVDSLTEDYGDYDRMIITSALQDYYLKSTPRY